MITNNMDLLTPKELFERRNNNLLKSLELTVRELNNSRALGNECMLISRRGVKQRERLVLEGGVFPLSYAARVISHAYSELFDMRKKERGDDIKLELYARKLEEMKYGEISPFVDVLNRVFHQPQYQRRGPFGLFQKPAATIVLKNINRSGAGIERHRAKYIPIQLCAETVGINLGNPNQNLKSNRYK